MYHSTWFCFYVAMAEHWHQVFWHDLMKNIVFICTANICRSPMAQKLFEKKLAEESLLEQWRVSSLGTWAIEGLSADPKAVRVMREWNIDLSRHRSRIVNWQTMSSNDLILVMESKHKEALQYEFPMKSEKIFMLSEMVGAFFDIPDPYRKSLAEFRSVANQINTILTDGFEKILTL